MVELALEIISFIPINRKIKSSLAKYGVSVYECGCK